MFSVYCLLNPFSSIVSLFTPVQCLGSTPLFSALKKIKISYLHIYNTCAVVEVKHYALVTRYCLVYIYIYIYMRVCDWWSHVHKYKYYTYIHIICILWVYYICMGAHNPCTRNSDEICVASHWLLLYVVFNAVLFIHIIREFIILVKNTIPIYYYYFHFNIDIAGR